ncbi:MAG TPA: hypothetical protein VN429_07465 [Methanospirillum sp.]|uniref:hypothetical protein n=1 Tax=Methanospirillum sp. TaxID=45200 RepID=UPI002C3C4C57|nr:hypothetical protein [Methanospirillum sp.]HWQ64239.1 hypothetical protein [Methanospirillum sp.]
MVRIAEFHTRQTAGYDAKAILQNQGYEVAKVLLRSTNKPGKIGLIAWNRLEMLFVCIRSYRGRFHLQEDIDALSLLHRSGAYPGEIQYWVRQKSGWIRYRICSGGAIRLRGSDDASS